MTSTVQTDRPDPYDAVVVGAGFAGLRTLYRLRGIGLCVRVLEAGDDVGGTWYWNRYPGARCDVYSVDYSYSFSEELDQEWVWSERYATQPEILKYIHHVADRFDLRRDVQLRTRVVAADPFPDGSGWTVRTDTGETLRCSYLIMAVGCLSSTKLPTFEGLDTFTGEWYHTGDWPHRPIDFTGKRVGVIGTGSSGIQIIPQLAETAGELTVFQRTPNFSIPAYNGPLSADELAEVKANYPQRRQDARMSPTGYPLPAPQRSALDFDDAERNAIYEQEWKRAGFGFILTFSDLLLSEAANATAADFIRRKIAEVVDDPRTAEMLTPKGYPFGAKRPCVDSNYFTTFNRDNVSLVDVLSDPIQAITPNGLKTMASEYQLDVLVFATGFDAMTGSLLNPDIRSLDGTLLKDKWANGPMTYLGLMSAGYPNLFVIAGPGSPSVLGNVVVSIEQHVEWLAGLLDHIRSEEFISVDASSEAELNWIDEVNATADATLYPQGNSWYLGPHVPGHRRMFMPYAGGLRRYRRRCDQIAQNGYDGFVFSK
jgi:cyclohexanone monooxygenase